MRRIQVLLGLVLVVMVALGPVAAWAETPAKLPKATSSARSKSAKTAPAAPALPPSPVMPKTMPPAAPGEAAFPVAPKLPVAEKAPPVVVSTPETPPPAKLPGAESASAKATADMPGAEPAARPNVPYPAYVNADLVNIRSGPGLYYYPVASVGKNVEVIVQGESGDWLAVKPMEGVYGLMKRGDITLETGGKAATVSAANARVYASGPSAKRQWSVMCTLQQGDKVELLGPAEGDMFRVAPPESARVYVASQYVVAGEGPAGLGSAFAKIEPPQVDPLVEDYKKADAALAEEDKKPIGERDYKSVSAAFDDIAKKSDKAYLKQAARERLALIAAMADQQKEYLRVSAIGDRLDKKLAELKAQQDTRAAEAQREKMAVKQPFVAQGLLGPLESMENVDYPIKFKLVDQANHPLVVLRSTAYDLSKYVGKVVGIRGPKTYLREWRIYLVTVDDLEVIE